MNCKPGDWAIFVNAPPGMEHCQGMVIRVLADDPADHARNRSWLYEGHLHCNFVGGRAPSVFDCHLQPINGDSLVKIKNVIRLRI